MPYNFLALFLSLSPEDSIRRHLEEELATGANLTKYFPFLLLLIKMGMRVTEEAFLVDGVLCCLVVLVLFPVAWPFYPIILIIKQV